MVKPLVCIGICAYGSVAAETMEDYLRFAFYLGRRCQDYEFVLAVKTKSEQFRARTGIVKGALQTGAQYILMLDDDHVIDWENTNAPSDQYGFVEKFIKHMEADPSIGIVGALYYQRGGECKPVFMNEGTDGAYYFADYAEVKGGLQEVAVTGGGCMLLRASMFDKLEEPWFEPEHQFGTDVQICRQARGAGFKVFCDTSITLGHVLNKREIVTQKNYLKVKYENMPPNLVITNEVTKAQQWDNSGALNLYRMDAEDYLKSNQQEMGNMVLKYSLDMQRDFDPQGDLKAYYASRDKSQVARQVWYHHQQSTHQFDNWILVKMGTVNSWKILDWGCGSSPVGFELALRGHKVDFVDVEGAGAYEFVKWRAAKYGLNGKAGWKVDGPYDAIMLMDVVEHLPTFAEIEAILPTLKVGGVLITNFFILNTTDTTAGEHINADKIGFKNLLIQNDLYPMDSLVWVRRQI